MKMFFLCLLILLVMYIIIQLRAFSPLLLAGGFFYLMHKAGIFTGFDIVGIFAAVVVFIGCIVYLEYRKIKRKEKKQLNEQLQRLANFSKYIPKDDYPELYEKRENDDWKQKPG